MGLFKPSKKFESMPTAEQEYAARGATTDSSDGGHRQYTEDDLRRWAMDNGYSVDTHNGLLVAEKRAKTWVGDSYEVESFHRNPNGTWTKR